MGNCIICGIPVDGEICESHEEDVVFEFHGNAASQLTPSRYYRGTVDGYADFGVFVDVGDHVTGLLHRSEARSTTREPRLGARRRGIRPGTRRSRQRQRRPRLVDPPARTRVPRAANRDGRRRVPARRVRGWSRRSIGLGDRTGHRRRRRSRGRCRLRRRRQGAEPRRGHHDGGRRRRKRFRLDRDGGRVDSGRRQRRAREEPALNRTTIDAIDDQVGTVVRLEGEIVGVRQTSGPTVFELRDETGTVECAAFEEAGVRAYPPSTSTTSSP